MDTAGINALTVARGSWRARFAELVNTIARRTLALRLFTRFSAIGFSLLVPLLAAAAAANALSLPQIALISTVAVAFHLFGYVLNDVIDLPVDRVNARRPEFPLVKGTISPRAALIFAVLNAVLAILLAVQLGGPGWSLALLALGLGLTVAYDVWGKRIRLPFVADVIQSCAWSALALWAVAAVNAAINVRAGIMVCVIFTFALLANGVHGALRDVSDDLRCGVSSTAIMLGARPRPDGGGGIQIPPRLVAYAVMLQLTVTLASVSPLLIAPQRPMRAVAISIVLVLGIISFALLVKALRARSANELSGMGLLHLVAMLGMPIAGFSLSWHPLLVSLIVVIYLVPVLTHNGLYGGLFSLFREWSR